MSSKPRKLWWRRILKWLTIIVVSLVILAILAWSIAEYVTTKQLNAEIAKIRQAKEPLAFVDIAGDAPDNLTHDAGRYYAAVLALAQDSVETWEVEDAVCAAARGESDPPLTQEVLDRTRRMIAEQQHLAELLELATGIEACHYDIGINHGMGGVVLERLNSARRVAQHQSLRVNVLVLDGQPDAAVDRVMETLRMRRIFHRHPLLITYLVEVAVMHLASRDVTTILQGSAPSDEALQRLADALRVVERPDALERVMLTERVYELEIMKFSLSPDLQDKVGTKGRGLWHGTLPAGRFQGPFARRMLVGQLRGAAYMIEASRQDWPDVLDAVANTPEFGFLFDILPPAYERAVIIVGRTLGTVRTARCAVLVELYRRRHGQLPHTLDQLVPEFLDAVPVDPFTGKALTYKTEEDGSYSIYSIGNDRKDQGGLFESPEENGDARDWGVRIRPRAVE